MNAYEIRLELLKMSKDLLMEEWHARLRSAENVYFQQREIAMASEWKKEIVPALEIPEAVTVEKITELAGSLNDFVSRT